jgi:phosphate transport system permease protein
VRAWATTSVVCALVAWWLHPTLAWIVGIALIFWALSYLIAWSYVGSISNDPPYIATVWMLALGVSWWLGHGLSSFAHHPLWEWLLPLVTLAWLWDRLLSGSSPWRRLMEWGLHGGCRLSAWAVLCLSLFIFWIIGSQAGRFFSHYSWVDFAMGFAWSPQTASRWGESVALGAVPVVAGSLLISAIGMAIALPLGLLIAVYTVEYGSSRTRRYSRMLLEVMAGVPTVVYGVLASFVVGPWIQRMALFFGYHASSESALAAGSVIGLMILPYFTALAEEALRSVPKEWREASWSLGATVSETSWKVVVPAAWSALLSAGLLAVSRALGETMIVSMASGLTARLTVDPLASVTTITAQMVSLLLGDQQFDSPRSLAAYALGTLLLLLTLLLNTWAHRSVVRRLRQSGGV